MSILKQRLPSATVSELHERKRVYRNRNSSGNLQASVVNPAYCIVKSHDGVTLPESHKTAFDSVYSGGNLRHSPILKSVTITHGGNFGMVITADVEIECYTLQDFNNLEKHFCRAGKLVSIAFGYAKPFNPNAYTSNGKFEDMMISSYEFNTSSETTWSIKFKATSGVEAVKSLDMVTSLDGNDHGKFLIGDEKYDVESLVDLMLHHSQLSGEKNTSMFDSGTVLSIPNMGHCVLYRVDDALKGKVSGWDSFKSGLRNFTYGVYGTSPETKSEADSHYLEYFTLEYVVNLFNEYIHPQYNNQVQSGCSPPESKTVFSKLSIEFSDEDSKSIIPRPIISANPFDVLLLGGQVGYGHRGNYWSNQKELGIRFYDDVVKNGDISSVKCYIGDFGSRDNHIIDTKKILISMNVIISALNSSRPTREDRVKDDISEEEDSIVKVNDFFNTIFQEISNATVGSIRLRLSEHPLSNENSAYKNKLYVVDEANASGKVDVVMFDIINGDGITKTASVTSGVGSQTYQAAMFQGTNRQRDAAAVNCKDSDIDAFYREMRAGYISTHSAIFELITGRLVEDGFASEHLSTLASLLRKMKNLHPRDSNNNPEQLVYPGLGCSVELEGVYGFIPGVGMMLNTIPNDVYLGSGRYFYIDSVVHSFQGDTSEWTTKLEGKLNMTSKGQINTIDLRGA